MKRPPKRKRPGLAATGNLSKKQSGAQHAEASAGVKIIASGIEAKAAAVRAGIYSAAMSAFSDRAVSFVLSCPEWTPGLGFVLLRCGCWMVVQASPPEDLAAYALSLPQRIDVRPTLEGGRSTWN